MSKLLLQFRHAFLFRNVSAQLLAELGHAVAMSTVPLLIVQGDRNTGRQSDEAQKQKSPKLVHFARVAPRSAKDEIQNLRVSEVNL